MIKPIKILATLSIFLITSNMMIAQEINESHKDSLETIVSNYYSLNLKVFQANSKVVDIDNIFQLFTEDFIYVHPKYGGTYTREKLYNGYVRNQKNGGYNGSIIDIKIINKIIGLNGMVVEKRFVEKKDGVVQEGNSEMTLFEFKNGKISKIFEYW
ncbi:nuclear transport factor 2 family protein [Aquimarina rubra]|uniref:Nuclear transport factor 2 family protein n=1 Tax=Aquimarina rubra TaxID=1920033 RepID=A0ABW5L923_9FLAO